MEVLGFTGQTLGEEEQDLFDRFFSMPDPAYIGADGETQGPRAKVLTRVSRFLADVEGADPQLNKEQQMVHGQRATKLIHQIRS